MLENNFEVIEKIKLNVYKEFVKKFIMRLAEKFFIDKIVLITTDMSDNVENIILGENKKKSLQSVDDSSWNH